MTALVVGFDDETGIATYLTVADEFALCSPCLDAGETDIPADWRCDRSAIGRPVFGVVPTVCDRPICARHRQRTVRGDMCPKHWDAP